MSDTSLIFNLLAIDKASEKILGVKSAFGLLAVGVAAGAATFAEKSIKMAADFESSTTRLVTSAGETHQGLEVVRKGMLDMAGQVGDSAQSLSQAMYIIESGGQHGADGLKVLRAAAEGAKAENADLTTVSDALTSVLQDYHLKASDSAKITSEMVAAVGAGKTTFEQFSGSLHSVLPLASQAGISFEDISAAIVSMTVHGMSADQATQNLNDTIRHMLSPLDTQKNEMRQLNVESTYLSDELGKRGLNGTLQDLSQLILSKMGPSGKILLATFNQSKDAARDANAMIANMPKSLQDLAHGFQQGTISLGDWRKDLKALPTEQANLLQQFAAVQNKASGFNDALKAGGPVAQNYVQALRAATGDATGLNTALMLTGENTAYVNGTIKTISGATTEAGGHVKGWSDVQSTFNQQLSEFKAYMGSVTIEIGTKLLPVAKDMLKWTMDSVQWLGKHKDVTQVLVGVIGGLAGAMLLYKTYLIAANVAEKVATVGKAAWTVATNVAKVATLAWTGAQALANSTLGTWIGVQAIDFAAWVRKAITVTGNTVALVAHVVAVNAVRVATLAWTAVQWALNVAMDANPIGLIVLAIAVLVGAILYLWFHSSAFRKFWIEVWDAIWSFLKAVGHWFANDFANFFVGAYHWIMNAATETHNWVIGKWNALIGFVTGIPAKIRSAASGMWDGIKDAFKGAINWIIDRWNGLQFKIPSVDFLGIHTPGFTLGVPTIPHLAAGGVLTRGGLVQVGERGAETVALPAGSAVYPHGSTPAGGKQDVTYLRAGDAFGQMLIDELRRQIGKRGGNPVIVLAS